MTRPSWTSITGGLILLATAFLFYHTFEEVYQTSILTAGRGPVFFPRIVLGAMMLFSVIVIIEGIGEESKKILRNSLLTVGAVILLSGAYILSIATAGFLIPTAIFTFLLPWLLGYRKWLISLAIAAIYPVAVWYIFEKVFLIILPSSPWFEAF